MTVKRFIKFVLLILFSPFVLFMMGLVLAPVYRSPAAGKMYDSESLLLTLAKWCGMWSYVID